MTSNDIRWAPVVGREGEYEVSEVGEVRSIERIITTKAGWTRRAGGKVLRPNKVGRGYLAYPLGRGKRSHAHVLVLEAFVGPRPNGMHACHNNGDPLDNRVSNLRWGSPTENMRDKRLHGTDHNVNKTHCPQGHELTRCNNVTFLSRVGRRQCRACAASRAYLQRHPDADFQYQADRYFTKFGEEG